MSLAFLGMLLAFLLSLLQLAYYNFPGVFLLQLGFGNCFFASPAHTFWTLVGLFTPVLTAALLWRSSEAFQAFPRHPLFAFHHLVLFLAGMLLANGFFGLRLLNRLDSAPLQATLLVGFYLTLDRCLRILGGPRIAISAAINQVGWYSSLLILCLSSAYFIQDLKPTLLSKDLGVFRLRFLGRAFWESPCPICLSAESIKSLPERTHWSSAELEAANLSGSCLAWPLRWELPSVWRECVSQPIRSSAPYTGSFPRQVQSLVEGDFSVGDVLILSQISKHSDDTPQARWDAYDTQAAILQELMSYPNLARFNEFDCQGELPLERQNAERIRQQSSLFASLFQSNSNWSPAYKRVVLSTLGAVDALDHVTTLRSFPTAYCEDPKLRDLERLEAHLEHSTSASPGFLEDSNKLNALRYEYRERQTVLFLHQYLASHPGAKVLLVYDEAHRLPRELWSERFGARLPRVQAVRWITPLAASSRLDELKEPKARLDWIQSSPSFLLRSLAGIRQSSEVWALLPKLQAEVFRDASKEAALTRLIAMLEKLPFRLSTPDHLRLQEWIWASYHACTGPFHGYALSAPQQQEWKAMNWQQQSKALENFEHPYQQWLALQSMSRVDLRSYPHLMMPQARLFALDRLVVPAELQLKREDIHRFLAAASINTVDPGAKIRTRLEQLYGKSESTPRTGFR